MKHTTLFLSMTAAFTLMQQAYAADHENELPAIEVSASKETLKKTLKEATSEASVATKVNMDLKDVPQTVNVIPGVILRERGITSMQEAVLNAPGVTVSTGDGQRDQASIRGFSTMYDNLVDGFRDDSTYYRDLSNIERVEIIQGPASVLYGRGSAGGLINRVTKKPLDTELREVSLIGNTLGQRRSEFDLNQPVSQDVKVRLTGAVEDSDGKKSQYYLERQAIAAAVDWAVSDRTKVLFQADYLHDDRLMDLGMPSYAAASKANPMSPYHAGGRSLYLGAANGKRVGGVESHMYSGAITLDHVFNDNLKYRGTIRAYQYDLDRQMLSPGSVTATNTVTIGQSRLQKDEHGITTQHELAVKFATASIQHEALVGFEYAHQNKRTESWSGTPSGPINLNNIVLPTMTAVNTSVRGQLEKDKNTNYALYLQDLISLTPEWKVLLGVRFDDLEQKRVKTSPVRDYNRSDKTVSPRAGLIYQPIEQLSLYTSYSKSFQPLTDSYRTYANLDDLKPTKTESYEVGAKWDVTPDFNTSLAVFRATQNNIFQADPTNTLIGVLAGEQRSKGVTWSFAGNLTQSLSVLGGYAYQDAKMIKSVLANAPVGNRASLTPEHSATIWMKYQINEGWYAALGGRAESIRYATTENKTKLPGYAVLNAAIGYQQEKYDVILNLNNILDRTFFISAHGVGGENANLFGDSRNAQLIARYRF